MNLTASGLQVGDQITAGLPATTTVTAVTDLVGSRVRFATSTLGTWTVPGGREFTVTRPADPGDDEPAYSVALDAELAAILANDDTQSSGVLQVAATEAAQDAVNALPVSYADVYDIRSFLTGGATLDRTGATSVHALIITARDAIAANYTSTGRSGQIYFPAGRYRIDTRLTWKSGVGIRGESRDSVIFQPQAAQSFIHQNDRTRCDDCSFTDFTVDGAAQVDSVYTAQVKGIYITDMKRARFERVTVKNTWSSGFGVDYLHESLMADCYAINCGRGIKVLSVDPATTSGGSGFGIGTGATQVETLQIVNCHAIDNALHGFFTEKQNQVSYYSRGFTMTGCTARGNWIGFRDCGSIGALVQGNQFIDNGLCGVSIDKTVLAANAGQSGLIAGNIISGNGALAGIAPGGGVVIAQAALGSYTIRANEIHGNTGPGINVPSTAALAARFAILGNRIHDNTGTGVTVAANSASLTVADNEAWGNTGTGFALTGTRTATGLVLVRNDGRDDGFTVAHTLAGSWTVADNLGFTLTDPTGLSATAGGTAGTIAATWTAPFDATGVTDYVVEYRTAGGGAYTTFSHTASTATSITLTGLSNSTAYDVRVAASRSGTLSGYAGPVTVTSAGSGATGIVGADTFDRADATGLGAAETGGTWAYDLSTGPAFTIVSNTARRSGHNSNGMAWLPVTIANGEVSAVIPTGAVNNTGVMLRYVDSSNYIWADCTLAGGLRLFVRAGGANTTGPTATGMTAGAKLTLRAVGTAITVLVNDVERITYTQLSGPSAGYAGLRASSTTTAPSIWESFEAKVL